MHIVNKQSGLTLIEMMIAILIGLIVMAGTIGVAVTSINTNSDNLQMMRLNQELQAVMTLMTRDTRRAGHWANTDPLFPNPFAMGLVGSYMPGGTDWTDSNNIASTSRTFSYDADADGIDDGNDEEFGFRLNGNQVEMLDSNNAWLALTDPTVVNVTNLAFTVDVWCPSNVGCIPPVGIEVRELTIILTGVLANDVNVSRTLTEIVRLRNDRVF